MSFKNPRVSNLKGEEGGLYITDTAAHTGDWDVIVAHEAAVAAITSSNISGTLTAVVLPVGLPIYGRFSAITLASGSVMAYNAV